jgi:hypothetical protein
MRPRPPQELVQQTEDPEDVNPVLSHVAFEEARVPIYRV